MAFNQRDINNVDKRTTSDYTSEQTLYTYYGQAASYSEPVSTLNHNINEIFGAPYQFMESVDMRSEETGLGNKYSSKILGPMNLLMLVPCKQKFMADFNTSDRGVALRNLIGDAQNGWENGIEGSGKYYTTELAYDKYYETVNYLCNALAKFMGIQNETVYYGNTSSKAGSMNCRKFHQNSAFEGAAFADSAVLFYVDGGAEQSESFTNDTTESSLASTLNGFSDQMNEIKFLLGNESGLGQIVNAAGNIGSDISNTLSQVAGGLTGGMLASLAERGTSTILQGGKIIFPKLWSNSGFSRSYSFDIKLRSPDHDNVSIFMNLFVPLIHLLALTLPIGMDNDANGYKSPFLVKAYNKGFFNIDMGIVSGLSVTRGGEAQWNDDGLPTQINVSIEIEDLYSTLSMPPLGMNPLSNATAIVQNTSMMDYLANLGGLNIAESELNRAASMWNYMVGNSAAGTYFWDRINNGAANFMYKLYRKLGAVQ